MQKTQYAFDIMLIEGFLFSFVFITVHTSRVCSDFKISSKAHETCAI